MSATTRPRSDSVNGSASTAKKARVASPASASLNLPAGQALTDHTSDYAASSPYKYAAVGGLISDELLEAVVEESRTYGVRGEEGSLPGWGWEQKETDIYKIQQTPDLSSLDPEHLPKETLAALPQLSKLKDALYSAEFRKFIRDVTGCGPLSGKKTDGSVGLYTQGYVPSQSEYEVQPADTHSSHLLLHDDSISTRLVSYILYLPNSPADAPSTSSVELTPSASKAFMKGWDPVWGGSLELYPVEGGAEVGPPAVTRNKKVDVKWGQLVFFEVQPGRSYHSVEEVVVGDGRQRLGVSGWFHRPVEGEEGYEPFDKEKASKDLSSLAQITAAPAAPFSEYTSDPPAGLTPAHCSFLAKYLAPSYLSTQTLEKLSGQFLAASEIVLHNFLKPEVAAQLRKETEGVDKRDYPDLTVIPEQETGAGDGWALKGPSSKHRFLTLEASSSSTPTLSSIHTELFSSEAFRAWLSVVSSLAPMGRRLQARRFRRGLDYTLASGEEQGGEARLDVCLGATWWADVPAEEEDDLLDNGGWDCYLPSPDEGEDPAVYQSALAKKVEQGEDEKPAAVDGAEAEKPKNTASVEASKANGSEEKTGPSISINGQELEFDPDQFSPSDFDSDSEGGEEDDAPLLTLPVSFNKLLLVLRDPGVMKFVKYLSAGAKGSRWDVGGEWEVGMMEEEDGDDADGEAAQE